MKKLLLILMIIFTCSLFGQQQAEEKYEVFTGYQYGKYELDSLGLEAAVAALVAEGVNADTLGVIYINSPGLDTSGVTTSDYIQLIGFVDGAYITSVFIEDSIRATAGVLALDGKATNLHLDAASAIAITSVTGMKNNVTYRIRFTGTSNTVTFNDGNNLKLTGNLLLDNASDQLLLWSDGTNLYEVAFTSND